MDEKGTEEQVRRRLGIPSKAEKIIIFGETSHWDPNWLYTSEEYYQLRIQQIMDLALDCLQANPRRVFGIECLFFVRLYWDRNPHKRSLLRSLVNEGRLRLLGCGLTTPDTLLPEPEAILRDYLLGQEWLREHGMQPEPSLAYLPDNFGLSPQLPSLLRELGIDQAGITRIDGMHFIGCDYRLRSAFPLAGSSADLLLNKYHSLDFIWQAGDGSEVLTHWNAFTYFQGDMLASIGIIRWMGKTFGIGWRTHAHIARRIRRFIKQLDPLSQTPYLFCPIGCDFNDPIESLLDLLDTYNEKYFHKTGIWAVCAGLDDYLELVNFHRNRLPVLQLDPNPYWMGFYSSRPEIKKRCKELTTNLLHAENHLSENQQDATQALSQAWDLVAITNHHDFITGTSPDRVWHQEQRPWLDQAEALANQALGTGPKAYAQPKSPSVRWRFKENQLQVNGPYYSIRIDRKRGGCMVSWLDEQGRELLSGPGNDVVSFRDSGGLWRLGHEYRGGKFREKSRLSRRRARIDLIERDSLLEVHIQSDLEHLPQRRVIWFDRNSHILRMRLVGNAPNRRSLCVRFPGQMITDKLTMDVPGGVIERPANKLYSPTFWPARSFVHQRCEQSDMGFACVMGGPASISSNGQGQLDLMAFRNAPREMAFGFLPVMAHPATGNHPEQQTFDYTIWSTIEGDWLDNQLPAWANRALFAAANVGKSLSMSREDVLVEAYKPAHRGPGVIVRLANFGSPGKLVLTCRDKLIDKAFHTDARERDIKPLRCIKGEVEIDLTFFLTTVRILFKDD